MAAVRAGEPLGVTALAVHGVMEATDDPLFRDRLNLLDLVTPDGQPVRWALNWLFDTGLVDRVYGPRLMSRLVERAQQGGVPVYFYGSTAAINQQLVANMRSRHAGLIVAGSEPSVFKELTDDEMGELARRIQLSGARLVFVGLGCPRQEIFVSKMRGHLRMPLLAVGAAFDYHADALPEPSQWVQRSGLEWAWRLLHEPKRLWRRYLIGNPRFVVAVARQWRSQRRTHSPRRPRDIA